MSWTREEYKSRVDDCSQYFGIRLSGRCYTTVLQHNSCRGAAMMIFHNTFYHMWQAHVQDRGLQARRPEIGELGQWLPHAYTREPVHTCTACPLLCQPDACLCVCAETRQWSVQGCIEPSRLSIGYSSPTLVPSPTHPPNPPSLPTPP